MAVDLSALASQVATQLAEQGNIKQAVGDEGSVTFMDPVSQAKWPTARR